MKLMMYIGYDLIESIPLDDNLISKPGYLGSIKRSLKSKYRELVQQYSKPPEFLVIDPRPPVYKSGNGLIVNTRR
jgi:hypothetical protein